MDGMQNLLSDLILFRLPEGSLPQRLLSSDAAARSELVVARPARYGAPARAL